MGTERDVRAWLRQRGAESVDHPGGTLYAHLGRVHDRLAALGLGAEVRLAGLAHAAYGTDGFAVKLLETSDRAELRKLIGADAERLVYRYGACERDLTWRDLARTGTVHDRFTWKSEALGHADLRSFADLTIINELDVVEQSAEIAAKHGEGLRVLFASWEPITSAQVVAEARRVLGG